MPTKVLPSLPKLLYSFFHEWLSEQRNASHRTVLAYRDAWKMFLCFVAERQHMKVAGLGLTHLNRAEVLAFLQYIEKGRGASVRTRNCRLAALRADCRETYQGKRSRRDARMSSSRQAYQALRVSRMPRL
jgi:site-specific recombinase XerD